MKKMLLVGFLLTLQLGICQSGLTTKQEYPAILVVGKDSIVAFTATQARKLDGYRLDLKYSTELNTKLQSRIVEADGVIVSQELLIRTLKDEADNLYAIKEVDTRILEVCKNQVAILERKNKSLRIKGNLMGIGFVASVGGLIWLLATK